MLSKFNPKNYEYITQSFNMISHENWNRVWSAVTKMESKKDLDKVICPTLILIGEYDNLTNYQQEYIHKHIKNSELKEIKKAHHGTNLDNPKQVNVEIDRFLKNSLNQVSAGAGSVR